MPISLTQKAETIFQTLLQIKNTDNVAVFSYQDGYKKFAYSDKMMYDVFRYLKTHNYVVPVRPKQNELRWSKDSISHWKILKISTDEPKTNIQETAKQIFQYLLQTKDSNHITSVLYPTLFTLCSNINHKTIRQAVIWLIQQQYIRLYKYPQYRILKDFNGTVYPKTRFYLTVPTLSPDETIVYDALTTRANKMVVIIDSYESFAEILQTSISQLQQQLKGLEDKKLITCVSQTPLVFYLKKKPVGEKKIVRLHQLFQAMSSKAIDGVVEFGYAEGQEIGFTNPTLFLMFKKLQDRKYIEDISTTATSIKTWRILKQMPPIKVLKPPTLKKHSNEDTICHIIFNALWERRDAENNCEFSAKEFIQQLEMLPIQYYNGVARLRSRGLIQNLFHSRYKSIWSILKPWEETPILKKTTIQKRAEDIFNALIAKPTTNDVVRWSYNDSFNLGYNEKQARYALQYLQKNKCLERVYLNSGTAYATYKILKPVEKIVSIAQEKPKPAIEKVTTNMTTQSQSLTAAIAIYTQLRTQQQTKRITIQPKEFRQKLNLSQSAWTGGTTVLKEKGFIKFISKYACCTSNKKLYTSTYRVFNKPVELLHTPIVPQKQKAYVQLWSKLSTVFLYLYLKTFQIFKPKKRVTFEKYWWV